MLVIGLTIVSTLFAIISPKLLGNATNQIVDDYTRLRTYDAIHEKLPAGAAIPAGMTGEQFMASPQGKQLAQALPASAQEAVKTLDLGTRPTFHYDAILQIVLWLVGLYTISSLFRYGQAWLMTNITQKLTYQLRRDISEKINRLPLRYFDTQTHGEVLSRITNDVDTVSQTLNQSLSQMMSAVVMLVGILAMMLSISWLLTVVALLVVPLSMGLIVMITRRSQTQFIRQQDELGELNGHIEEMYAGHQVMRAFRGQERSLATFRQINQRLFSSAWQSQFLSGLMYPVMNVVGNIGYVGVAVLGGWLAIEGRIKIGDIQAFIQYMQQFNQPIAQTANIANVVQSTAAAAERVFEFLEEPAEAPDPVPATTLPVVRGEVEFRDVVFGYNAKTPVIKHLSAHIRPGQRVAIVGPTGAGKTTLVNLLMRFYDIDSGQILIDGVDIAQMTRSSVRQLFGMVLQDTWLFHGTIRDNLRYGNPEASEAELLAVARDAHVDHFVRSLPGGYDMVLDEAATNMSQGEKQLLTIARAMLAKTPMLILDEATSSVDTRTEVLIQQAMDRLMQHKTSFVIAHRLSTIRDADLILVMKDGNVIEQGTHDELLAQSGFYAELYQSQFAEDVDKPTQ
ncbi:MAG: ABC transporter ATP-binding protein [Candidatus Nanosynbacter sp.]|nr:ABC transporter ATP-binding protein [Candidatus Nanosynbacter sp.]